MSDNKDNFGIILTLLAVVFFIVSGFVIWVFLFSDFAFVHFLEPEKRIDSGIKALTTIGASFGGIALLTNAYYASRTAKAANDNAKAANENAEIARDKQITERFAKAIELIGNERLEVKLGGIYALEQIAKDSPEKYHWTIMEVLTAFVRENAPVKKVAEEDEGEIPKLRTDIQAALTVIGRRNAEEDEGKRPKLRTDIQAALTVIGRRNYEKEKENQRIDLSNIDIRDANLDKAHLEKASLYQANLQEAVLSEANLQEASLYQANLQEAVLSEANLQGANLCQANLQRASLSKANLQRAFLYQANLQRAFLYQANLQEAVLSEANLQGANLYQAKLQGAKFTSAKNLTSQQIESAEGDENTILPDDITRPKHWTKSE
ncbi:putative low-complexity protein [Cylindrospermum stagnale PCC 7417]|uniref:Putative low-complexity protein n=1 Tax=Cylindrospermum stagnale PCC 7417 TaxID=56107 RepID=K9X862_9NOST|nr:pentapeptide repeat-containing protein [Cylindrospermum stagnale]AFZ27852.1 putative low-complexity protein [Cylindrospermum stagnale PCC 7417]